MPLFENRLRRIFERLAMLRRGPSTRSQDSLACLAEALEEVTQAIKNIEQRVQALEEARRPTGLAHT